MLCSCWWGYRTSCCVISQLCKINVWTGARNGHKWYQTKDGQAFRSLAVPVTRKISPQESVDMVFLQTKSPSEHFYQQQDKSLTLDGLLSDPCYRGIKGCTYDQSSQWGQMNIQTWIKKGFEILECETPKQELEELIFSTHYWSAVIHNWDPQAMKDFEK